MGRVSYMAAAALLMMAPSLAQAGEASFGEVVPVLAWSGGISPLAKGALYNTPPSVSYAAGIYGSRRHHRHGRVLYARF